MVQEWFEVLGERKCEYEKEKIIRSKIFCFFVSREILCRRRGCGLQDARAEFQDLSLPRQPLMEVCDTPLLTRNIAERFIF
jgi:hypothetical protein